MVIISKIAIKPLHQEAADRIRELILNGVLKTGDRILEANMCMSLGISRTPFREALRILGSEGLVDLVPNKGAFVAQHSREYIREMFEVMSILEGACARMAAVKMTASALKQIESAHQTLEAHYEAGDLERYMVVNDNYHVLLQEMAGNKVLDQVINGLRQRVLLYRHQQLYHRPDRFLLSLTEHRRILEAFRAGDPDRAESLMKQHVTNVGVSIVGPFESGHRQTDSLK